MFAVLIRSFALLRMTPGAMNEPYIVILSAAKDLL